MPIYTPPEIYGFLREAGFTPDQATTMTAIALAESGGNSAHDAGGEDSRGLWQINADAHPGATGPYDPLADARAAYAVSKGGTDISPWTVAHGGGSSRFERFRPDALAAARVYGDDPSAGRPHRVKWGVPVVAAAALIVLVLVLAPRLTDALADLGQRGAGQLTQSPLMTVTSATQTSSASVASGSPSPPEASPSAEPSANYATADPATRAPTATPIATRAPASLPRATVVPTLVPSSPTVAPTPALSAHAVSLSVTSPVRRGFAAAARAVTTPGSRCTITVTYSSAASGSLVPDPRIADAAGGVSWSWTVPTATAPGTWPVDVTCISPAGQRAAARVTHQVQ